MNKREQTFRKTKFLLAGGAFVRIHWLIVWKRSIAGVGVTVFCCWWTQQRMAVRKFSLWGAYGNAKQPKQLWFEFRLSQAVMFPKEDLELQKFRICQKCLVS